MYFIHKFLKKIFHYLGFQVGKRPELFIVISVVIFLSSASGISRLKFNSDTDYLFTVENSKTKTDRKLIERYFPPNYADFDPSRSTRPGRFVKLIVAPKDENKTANLETWKEVIELDNIIQTVSFSDNGLNYNYSSICATTNENCYESEVLKYDKAFLKDTSLTDAVASNAVVLEYFISVKSIEDDQRGRKWESSVINELNYREGRWYNINVSRLTFKTLSEEPENNAIAVLPYIYATIIIIVIFTMLICSRRDLTESKSLVGFMGIVSSVLGASGACGLLGFMDVHFIGINLAVPFIALGIGLDDTFLMLSSWRRTSRSDPIYERMAKCYSESAVSISITSITDILSFYVGVLSPIPSIRIFSIYAGTCIFFIFLCNVLFFGAIIALNGLFEEQNYIGPSWIHLNIESQKRESSEKSNFHVLAKSEKVDKENTDGRLFSFEDIFAEFLYKTPVKMSIGFIYVLYIGTSLYGLSQLKDGLLRENLVRYDSYMSDYFIAEQKYFSRHPQKIQVVVTSPLDYYSNSTQSKISRLLDELTEDENSTASEPLENWLHDFSKHITQKQINITSSSEFILALKNLFLQNTSVHFANDVVFNEAKTEILASRFIVQSKGINDVNTEKSFYNNIQKILENTDLPVAVYHSYFDFIELHIITSELTIKLVGLAAAIVMLVSLLIIPSVLGSVCVSLSVVSIELGVLGFMSLWSIRLDLISVICLIMSIGFSVDFVAHVSYSFIACAKNITNNSDRLKHTFNLLALPIIQGAISTLIGVLLLAFVPSYIFQSFFKIVFLVMTFSVFHALFIAPIILGAIKPLKFNSKKIYHINT